MGGNKEVRAWKNKKRKCQKELADDKPDVEEYDGKRDRKYKKAMRTWKAKVTKCSGMHPKKQACYKKHADSRPDEADFETTKKHRKAHKKWYKKNIRPCMKKGKKGRRKRRNGRRKGRKGRKGNKEVRAWKNKK